MQDDYSTLPRRSMLALLGAAGIGSALPADRAQAATKIKVSDKPNTDAVELFARLVGDLTGKVTLSYMAGSVWGFRPQADDLSLADFARRIYGYKSLIARKVRRLPNGDFAIKAQGWTFYADPTTDVITETLRNPYSSKLVQPYSPPSAPFEVAYRSDGTSYIPDKPEANPLGDGETRSFDNPFDMRVKTIGAYSFVNTSQFIRFNPGNIDWFKLEATLISYVCRSADLANPKLTHVPSTSTMNLVAEWQTWMDMHGTPGHILFKGEGTGISSIAEAPADYRSALATKFPGQLEKALAW